MFGKKKTEDEPETNSPFSLGAEVEYRKGDNWRKGTIHGIREADGKVIGYLVDTGRKHMKDTIKTDEGEDDIEISQPVQADVTPENIRLPE